MNPAQAGSQGSMQRGLELARGLLLSLPAAVAYVTGPDLVFEFANGEYRRIVGDRHLTGRSYREALPEIASHQRYDALRRVLRTGEPYRASESELWLRRHGERPEQIFIDSIYQPVRDDAGHVAGVLLFGSDVTQHVHDKRKLAELAKSLATSEERYRTLFETLPHGVIHYSADGSVIGANLAASQIMGLAPGELTAWPADRAARAVHEDGTEFEPGELPVEVALRTGEVTPDTVIGVPHGRTGKRRWLRVTAVPDARDEAGRPQRAYAMISDITEQRRAEATAIQSAKLLSRLRDSNVLGVASATEHCVYEANDAFLDMIGYTRADVASGRVCDRSITAPEWADRDDHAMTELRDTGVFQAYDKEYLHRDGHRVPVMVGAAMTGRDPLRWVTFVVDLTAPQRAERERATLLSQTHAAVAEADAARERLSFLLKAGDLVAATGDRGELLEQVAQLVVPTLADCCVIFLPTVDGSLQAASLTHRDPQGAAELQSLRRLPIAPAGPLTVQAAYTDAVTQFVTDVDRTVPAGGATTQEMIDIEKRALLSSALATPLRVGKRPLGVVLMGRGDQRTPFAEVDIPVAEELGRRLAAGLANVETFAREHTVAETLQDALLPQSLPDIDGLDLSVSYLPAADGVHVGGDWYDAFTLGPGRLGLVIGDVAGHSIASASVMGQIRSVLLAYAKENPAPCAVLRRANAAVFELLPDALATVCYGVLDVSAGVFEYASAGHPPPLAASADGPATYLDGAAGVLLGAVADPAFSAGRARLAAGGRLLLYTDGLVEDRHRDISDGLATLAAALERTSSLTAAQTCQAVQEELLGGTPPGDDVCVVAARLTG